MGNFTNLTNGKAVEYVNKQPKHSTLELIQQYARVYTPLTTIAFSQLIAN